MLSQHSLQIKSIQNIGSFGTDVGWWDDLLRVDITTGASVVQLLVLWGVNGVIRPIFVDFHRLSGPSSERTKKVPSSHSHHVSGH